MNKNLSQILLSTILIIGSFFAVFSLSQFLKKTRLALPENYVDEDLALQGAKLKGFTLGFEGLIADCYWMQSLQYIGDKLLKNEKGIGIDDMRELNPRLLYPYLDNATALDPQFISVYEYGAMVLPLIDQNQAIKLLEKGIANNPKEWRLYHYLGYIYWRLKDYEKASATYAAGAKIEGAPNWMQIMVAKTKTDGENRETARIIYKQLINETQDEQTKRNAALRLMELDSLDEREVIQKVLNDFKLKNKRCADDWHEILPFLKNEKFSQDINFRVDNFYNLLDPSGVAYILDKSTCNIQLNSSSKIPQDFTSAQK